MAPLRRAARTRHCSDKLSNFSIICSGYGVDAMALAARHGQRAVMQLLREHVEDAVEESTFVTPLGVAAFYNQHTIVKVSTNLFRSPTIVLTITVDTFDTITIESSARGHRELGN